MAAAAAGIFNQHLTAAQALTGQSARTMSSTPTATGGSSGTGDTSSSSTSASGDSATISANDFLTLLVTEMQNQDPTADTDPNEYINQLVQVNSLEQLIDINQTLTADSAPAATPNDGTATPQAATAATAGSSIAKPAAQSAATSGKARPLSSAVPATCAEATQTASAQKAPGNLSVPRTRPAAVGVAHALDGRWHAHR